ncbi:MAG: hypothetical protein GVY35_13890 [Bacteroidetes bacterium]|jgi:hypothetical protein|nr:hypothetical protein [Bacteroidota bacterium]
MKAVTTPDALEKLARQIKTLDEQADVYFLPFDPHDGPSRDNDIHIAVLADVDDARMSTLSEGIAELLEAINLELGFDPFVVAHPTNRNGMLARTARDEGVRL